MKSKVLMSFYVIIFSILLVRCGNTPDPLTEAEQAAYNDLVKIREAIFQEVDKKEWSLVLVGKNETLIKDLCGDTDPCDYVETDLEKLVPEGKTYELLTEAAKKLITESNTFFAGDKVVVYDKDNNKIAKYLNAIHEALGDHELALLKKKVIEPLYNKNYGNVFWGASESEPIEAFADLSYLEVLAPISAQSTSGSPDTDATSCDDEAATDSGLCVEF